MSNLSQLHRLYYEPKLGLSLAKYLYNVAKQRGIPVTHNQVKKFLSEQESNQLFRPTTIQHYYPMQTGATPFYRSQIDLLDLSNESPVGNQGMKWIFCFIDTSTRYAFAVPMKTKSTNECVRAFNTILEQIDRFDYKVKRLDSDKEAAFRSHEFVSLCQARVIEQYFSELDDHKSTAFVERFNRTLSQLIERYKASFNTNLWTKALPDLVYNYNHRIHSNLGRSPADVLASERNEFGPRSIPSTATLQSAVLSTKKDNLAMNEILNSQKLKINDKVRSLIQRSTFDKGTAPRWTKQVQTITDIKNGLYYLSDRVHPLKGYQLLKVDKVEHAPDTNELTDAQQQHRANRRRNLNREGIEPQL